MPLILSTFGSLNYTEGMMPVPCKVDMFHQDREGMMSTTRLCYCSALEGMLHRSRNHLRAKSCLSDRHSMS